MRFKSTDLKGIHIIEAMPVGDERGHFARTFCEREFAEAGLEFHFVQHSRSRSLRKGTLRGMHFQDAPQRETKLVSCIVGAIHDVVVDLRPGSPTFAKWTAVELTEDNQKQLYIPEGFAHGFLTLRDDVVVSYLISAFHSPALSRGVRYDDPMIGIEWPAAPTVISERDLSWPRIGSGEAVRLPTRAPAVHVA